MTKITRERLILCSIVTIALVLRLYIGLSRPYQVHPDEVCDYLDRAFRIVYGYGCDPWTYTYGLRSYLFPGFLAGIIWLSSSALTAPDIYLGAVTVVMAVLSLSVVVCAIAWGRRSGGFRGAVIAGFITAIWFELIYYGPHALSEVMATNFLVVGVCAYRDGRAAPPRAGRLLLIGLCLGFTVALRLQLAPAVAVVVLWVGWHHGWRTMMRLTAIAAVPVFAAGMLDWVTYRYPFQSVFMYFYANLFAHLDRFYPTFPATYYLNVENHYLVGAFPFLLVATLWGGRRQPLLLLVAATILVSHSLISLKLPRYMYPAIPFALVLVAQTVTEAFDRLAGALRPPRQIMALAAILLTFAATSLSLGREGPFASNWLRSSGAIAAARAIAARPDVCGIAGYRTSSSMYVGYSRFHHEVPVFFISKPERFAEDAASFNTLVANDDAPPPGDMFARLQCWSNGYGEASNNMRMPALCLWVRPGGCRPGAVPDPDPDRPPGW